MKDTKEHKNMLKNNPHVMNRRGARTGLLRDGKLKEKREELAHAYFNFCSSALQRFERNNLRDGLCSG